MAFTGQSADQIRTTLLARWSSEYAARGKVLDVSTGSRAYLYASGFAFLLEGVEAQAEQVERDILPDQAGPDALSRHAYVNGIEPQAGFSARLTVTVTGAVAGTPYPIPAGTLMAYSDGTPYLVETASVTLSGGSPAGTITVRAVAAGAAGTRAVGDTLTFATAPTGLNSTGLVASVVRDGTDTESPEELAARIIARMRERPGSGNRADWKAWVEAYTGTEIETAYVYPLLAPPASFPGAGTVSTTGAVTVVAVGPAQGDSVTNTRIVPTGAPPVSTPGDELVEIEEYIEGDRLPDGTDVSATPNEPLRPATLPVGNYCVQAINTSSQDVVLALVVTAANAAQWSGTMTVVSSTGTELVVSGDQTANIGFRVLVNVTTTRYRGGYKLFTLGAGTFGGANTTFAVDDPDNVLPYATGTVYPAPGNFDDIRTAILAYFDALGPGDTSPASRWPTEDQQGRSTVYLTALAAAAIGVSGVLSATATTPAADVTPAAKRVVTLDSFRVTL